MAGVVERVGLGSSVSWESWMRRTSGTWTPSSSRTSADGDLTLDLSELTFVDSMGIGFLVTIAERLTERGSLVLLSPDHSVRRVLELVQLDQRSNVKIIDADSLGGDQQ